MTDRITQAEFRQMRSSASGTSLREIAEAAQSKASGENVQPAPSNWQKTRLVLPLPPSANRYWRTFRNVVVVSEEARAYKAGVKASALEQGATLIPGDVAVYIDVYRSRKAGDLDNRIKVALDALKGIAFEDDRQVVKIHARRFDDRNNGRIEITVETV